MADEIKNTITPQEKTLELLRNEAIALVQDAPEEIGTKQDFIQSLKDVEHLGGLSGLVAVSGDYGFTVDDDKRDDLSRKIHSARENNGVLPDVVEQKSAAGIDLDATLGEIDPASLGAAPLETPAEAAIVQDENTDPRIEAFQTMVENLRTTNGNSDVIAGVPGQKISLSRLETELGRLNLGDDPLENSQLLGFVYNNLSKLKADDEQIGFLIAAHMQAYPDNVHNDYPELFRITSNALKSDDLSDDLRANLKHIRFAGRHADDAAMKTLLVDVVTSVEAEPIVEEPAPVDPVGEPEPIPSDENAQPAEPEAREAGGDHDMFVDPSARSEELNGYILRALKIVNNIEQVYGSEIWGQQIGETDTYFVTTIDDLKPKIENADNIETLIDELNILGKGLTWHIDRQNGKDKWKDYASLITLIHEVDPNYVYITSSLSLAHKFARGVPFDLIKAHKYAALGMSKAIEQNDAEQIEEFRFFELKALEGLVNGHMNGKGAPKDVLKAHEAARLGLEKAQEIPDDNEHKPSWVDGFEKDIAKIEKSWRFKLAKLNHSILDKIGFGDAAGQVEDAPALLDAVDDLSGNVSEAGASMPEPEQQAEDIGADSEESGLSAKATAAAARLKATVQKAKGRIAGVFGRKARADQEVEGEPEASAPEMDYAQNESDNSGEDEPESSPISDLDSAKQDLLKILLSIKGLDDKKQNELKSSIEALESLDGLREKSSDVLLSMYDIEGSDQDGPDQDKIVFSIYELRQKHKLCDNKDLEFLANFCESGKGCEKNLYKAVNLYEELAEQLGDDEQKKKDELTAKIAELKADPAYEEDKKNDPQAHLGGGAAILTPASDDEPTHDQRKWYQKIGGWFKKNWGSAVVLPLGVGVAASVVGGPFGMLIAPGIAMGRQVLHGFNEARQKRKDGKLSEAQKEELDRLYDGIGDNGSRRTQALRAWRKAVFTAKTVDWKKTGQEAAKAGAVSSIFAGVGFGIGETFDSLFGGDATPLTEKTDSFGDGISEWAGGAHESVTEGLNSVSESVASTYGDLQQNLQDFAGGVDANDSGTFDPAAEAPNGNANPTDLAADANGDSLAAGDAAAVDNNANTQNGAEAEVSEPDKTVTADAAIDSTIEAGDDSVDGGDTNAVETEELTPDQINMLLEQVDIKAAENHLGSGSYNQTLRILADPSAFSDVQHAQALKDMSFAAGMDGNPALQSDLLDAALQVDSTNMQAVGDRAIVDIWELEDQFEALQSSDQADAANQIADAQEKFDDAWSRLKEAAENEYKPAQRYIQEFTGQAWTQATADYDLNAS